MSISSTFSSAMSGLAASSRMAEVTASNISNALTEGYARREVGLSSRTVGSNGMGVAIGGVIRHVDTSLLQDLRQSTAGQGYQQARSDFLSTVEKALGTPDAADSLSGRIARLERSLIEAAARPDSDARLAVVADAANGVARTLVAASQTIQEQRQRADTRIAFEVALLNDSLAGVADLNTRIRAAMASGRDTAGLMDQRQQTVDRISAIVPVREVARERGEIALFTSGGTLLLEGRPATLDFTRAGAVTAEMTLAPMGGLSGLSLKGQPLSTSPAGGRLGQGSLSAQFDIRDRLAT
jgi:flagellar hook-associated protein 1 FlgK